MANIRVKICGLTRPEDMQAVADAGAHYAGLNFFEKSPRYVSPEQAHDIALAAPVGLAKVALVVNASDAKLDDIVETVPLDMIQLHGSETPERVSEIKQRYGLPIMKVIGVATQADLANLPAYESVTDQILLDAKPPKDAILPGGNGLKFDWKILQKRKYWQRPWMLAGGLTPDNVGDAIRLTGARQVDVASGVESSPGIKDTDLMKAFCEAALTA